MSITITSNNFTDEQLERMDQMRIEKIERMSASQAFCIICKFRNSKTIREFIKKHELSILDYSYGLSYACKNEYVDIDTIELIISKYVQKYTDWKYVFINLCECVNHEIFEYIVKKCIEEYNKLDWERGFYVACSRGNIQIVKSILSKIYERNIKINWDEGLHNAYIGGNPEIVDLMISKGAEIGFRGVFRQDMFTDNTSLMLTMVPKYREYKRTQTFKYTKMHESLIDFVSNKFKAFNF